MPLLDENVETSQEIPHRTEFCLHFCQWFPVLQTHTPVPYLHFARKSNTANIKVPASSHINQIHTPRPLAMRFSCIILRAETRPLTPPRTPHTQSTRVPHPRCPTGRTVLSYKIKRNGVMKVFDLYFSPVYTHATPLTARSTNSNSKQIH